MLVGNCHGFVGNRMYTFMTSEAAFLVEEGALPEEVDAVMEDYGFPLGCFKVGDLSGKFGVNMCPDNLFAKSIYQMEHSYLIFLPVCLFCISPVVSPCVSEWREFC